MIDILEEKSKKSKTYDSCAVQIPKEFAVANGLPEKSFVSLTLKNGKLESEIIDYSDADENEVDDFIADFPKFDEEMKRFGD